MNLPPALAQIPAKITSLVEELRKKLPVEEIQSKISKFLPVRSWIVPGREPPVESETTSERVPKTFRTAVPTLRSKRVWLIVVSVVLALGLKLIFGNSSSRNLPGQADPLHATSKRDNRFGGEQSLSAELNLDTSRIGADLAVFAYTPDQVDTALSTSRVVASSGETVIISFPALASAIVKAAAESAFELAVVPTQDRTRSLTITGNVPVSLRGLFDTFVNDVRKAMRSSPFLSAVKLIDRTTRSSSLTLVAIFMGSPRPVAFFEDGAHYVGDTILGRFAITAIESDSVVLGSKDKSASGNSKYKIDLRHADSLQSTADGAEHRIDLSSATITRQQFRSISK